MDRIYYSSENTYSYVSNNSLKYIDDNGDITISENCRKLKSGIKNSIDRVKNNINECSYIDNKPYFNNLLDEVHFRCFEKGPYGEVCGYSFWYGALYNIGLGIYCNICLEDVILHEIAHLRGYSHSEAMKIETKCSKCMQKRECKEINE